MTNKGAAVSWEPHQQRNPTTTKLVATAAADASQVQYIKVADPYGNRWIANADGTRTTDRPEYAHPFEARQALATYQRLSSVGYPGLSLINALPTGAGLRAGGKLDTPSTAKPNHDQTTAQPAPIHPPGAHRGQRHR